MKQLRWALSFAICGAFFLAMWWLMRPVSSAPAASGDTSPSQDRRAIVGSTTLEPAVTRIARQFEALYHSPPIEVSGGGSKHGIVAVAAKAADIGMSSRALTPSETGLQLAVIGYDGLGLLVQDACGVSSLNSQQIRDIYTGTIKRWNELGGADEPIICITRKEGRGEQSQFLEYFHLSATELRSSKAVGGNDEAMTAILENPYAIVYMSLGLADAKRDTHKNMRLLAIDGVDASTDNILNGRYPIIRPLILVTRPDASPWVQDFVRFTQSPVGKKWLREYHLLPNGN